MKRQDLPRAQMNSWKQAQVWESKWWEKCQNTLSEELKQIVYAGRMGLIRSPNEKTPYRFDMEGKSVLDIGGGPTSLLLRCVNVKGKVIDPITFPPWVYQRYEAAGIRYSIQKAENLDGKEKFDECWIYNVLQHTEDPAIVIKNARAVVGLIRIFEWINMRPCPGHLQILTREKLDEWLNGEGKVEGKIEGIAEVDCIGKAYYGIFPTGLRKE
ncbi:hypothetical protein ES703_60031 [subsurface metagenome]